MMKNIREGRPLKEQKVLLKRKVRKLEKHFARVKPKAVLQSERIIKTMTSVQRRLTHIEEALNAVH
jgi:hypothetical protein